MVFGMGTLYTYILAFIQHWWAIVAAGMFFGIDEVLRRWGADEVLRKWAPDMMERLNEKVRPYRRPLQILFLIGAVFYAGFAAWRDEHKLRIEANQETAKAQQEVVRAEVERDEARRQLTRQIPWEMSSPSAQPVSPEMPSADYMETLSPEQASAISTLGANDAEAIGKFVVGYFSTWKTVNLRISISESLTLAGINIDEKSMIPDNPKQTGIMLSCEDTNNITDAGARMERIFKSSGVDIKRIPLLRVRPRSFL